MMEWARYTFIFKIPIKHLLYAKYHSWHWQRAVNKTDTIPICVSPLLCTKNSSNTWDVMLHVWQLLTYYLSSYQLFKLTSNQPRSDLWPSKAQSDPSSLVNYATTLKERWSENMPPFCTERRQGWGRALLEAFISYHPRVFHHQRGRKDMTLGKKNVFKWNPFSWMKNSLHGTYFSLFSLG
jgi:hypothetical protein